MGQLDAIMSYAVNYGFPMAVTGFLLVRIEAQLEALQATLIDLTKVISLKL